MKIEFFEACVPPRTSHHHKQIVKFGGFSKLADKPELVAAKSFWDSLFMMHRPEVPISGPLALSITLTWPWNAGDSKKVRAAGRIWHWTKPDNSNMTKTLEDAMGRCAYFNNDSQIADSRCRKYRGDKPGIYVLIEPAGEV